MKYSKLLIVIMLVALGLALFMASRRQDSASPAQETSALPDYSRDFSYPDYFNAESKAITDKAIVDAQAAIAKDPSSANAWIDLGNQYYLVRDYEGAKLCWDYVLILDPQIYVALANLGTLYMSDLKDYVKSEEYLKRAIALDSVQLDAYRSLYDLYRYALKDDVKAKAVLDDAIVKNPGTAMDFEYLRDHYDEQ